MVHEVHTYADLRKQIHEDLRLQHPEWIQPNGKSPLCDSYEARLMKTLQSLPQSNATILMTAVAANWVTPDLSRL
jgi:hypothetical protein